MYKFYLTNDTNFDFYLTKDEKEYKRDYSQYKVINIDLTKSLYSTGTTKNSSEVILTHIGLTGYDNGLITPPTTGVTLNTVTGITYTIPNNSTFKLNPVSGFTSGFTYSIVDRVITGTSRSYKQLLGGFYQGFFKLYGYPVEYFKTRANKGWSVNMLVAFTNNLPTGTTLNSLHPQYPVSENSGMLFYLGTRAENKYLYITGDTLVDKFQIVDNQPKYFTGRTISQINSELNSTLFDLENLYTNGGHLLLNGQKYKGFYNITNGLYYSGRTYNSGSELSIDYNYNDVIGNSFGIFVQNGKIGYRTIYATDPCFTGATQDVNNIGENTFSGYTSNCSDKFNVRKIITKKFTVEEVMSDRSVIDSSDNTERFAYISVVFERDFTYKNDCDLKYGKYKNGTLKIFINGSIVFNYDKFTEVIPHELDTTTYLQEGVSFNLSFGGGTQGLIDMYKLKDLQNIPPTVRLLDEFFSYSFIGGIRGLSMYMTPLDVTEINKEFNKIKSTYNMFGRTGGRFNYYRNNGY